MSFERIDELMLCKGYWVIGNHKGHEQFICIQDIYENGILCSQARFFLFEHVSGIELTHEWLEATGAEHLTEDVLASNDGAYRIPGFPFIFLLHEYVAVLYNNQTFAGFRFVHELQHFYAGIKQRTLHLPMPDKLKQIEEQQMRINFPQLN